MVMFDFGAIMPDLQTTIIFAATTISATTATL